MDLAITMRFHATIFARSQGVPVLGIDYYPGVGGKVEQLFADAGEPGNACRMDTFTPEWLVERAEALTGASRALAPAKS
jgi:polysaccharide pyruvyl transferase WcaK-like protein